MKKTILSLMATALLAQGCVAADMFHDPVSGTWAYYQDGGIVLMDNAEEHALTPVENRYYATSGTVDGIIFVARCAQHNDDRCIATDLAMMNKNGELLNRFGEFKYPQLEVSHRYPESILHVDVNGKRENFPMWGGRTDLNTDGKRSTVFIEDRLVVEQNGMYGFLDRNGDPVVTPRFLAVKNFQDGRAIVISDQGVGSVDPYGHYTKEQFACVLPYDEQYTRVNVDGTLVNYRLDLRTQSDIYVSKSLDLSVENHPNSSNACQGGKWGLVDAAGNIVIPPAYDDIIPEEGTDFLWVYNHEKHVVGIYTRSGHDVIPPEYPFIVVGESFFLVQNHEGKFSLFDTKGKQVTEFVFDNYQSTSRPDNIGQFLLSEYAVLSKDGLWGVVTPDGRVTVPFTYEQLGPESEGLISFRDGKKRWGVIDTKNTEVKSAIYGSVGEFHDGRAEAELAGDTIYIYRDHNAESAWREKMRLDRERAEAAERQAAQEARERNAQLAQERLEEERRQTQMLAGAEIERLRKELDMIDRRLEQLQHQYATTKSATMEEEIRRQMAERRTILDRIAELQNM